MVNRERLTSNIHFDLDDLEIECVIHDTFEYVTFETDTMRFSFMLQRGPDDVPGSPILRFKEALRNNVPIDVREDNE